MRYLIFNFTVLAALGYLFMASPDQSFANWIGKAPQMFDAARTAGRDSMPGNDPTATAGRALIEAMEPVVEQVLSSSDDAVAEPTLPARFGEPATTTDDLQTVATPADPNPDGARPVTMQDIESIIRGLLDDRSTVGDDHDVVAGVDSPETSANDEAEIIQPRPKQRPTDRSSTGPASGVAASDQSMPTNATPNEGADDGSGVLEIADVSPAVPSTASQEMTDEEIADVSPAVLSTASQEMTDEEIAAAFASLQQAARPDPMPSGAMQSTMMAAAGDGQANGAPVEVKAVTSAPAVESPAFMSPGQRADSLALMVEELQLMYLERTGG